MGDDQDDHDHAHLHMPNVTIIRGKWRGMTGIARTCPHASLMRDARAFHTLHHIYASRMIKCAILGEIRGWNVFHTESG